MTLDLPPLFRVGLRPLAADEWLQGTDDPAPYLAQKKRLFAERMDDVFVAEESTRAAQREVLDLVCTHLGLPRIEPDGDTPHLIAAAKLVAEDFVIMRRDDEHWRLAAACVSFPSSWTLREKFRQPMGRIHSDVPGFDGGSRHGTMIERIFDRLDLAQILVRWNWSLYQDPDLHHPPRQGASKEIEWTADPFIRTERQTVRKLAGTGDVLFGIHIGVRRVSELPRDDATRNGLRAVADHLEALTSDQLAYKGMTGTRDRLVECLRSA